MDTRSAAQGAWSRLVGPLSGRESALVLGTAGAASAIVWCDTQRAGYARAVLMSAVAFDLVGGRVAFQLSPTRAAYRETSLESRSAFTIGHVQPFAVPITGQGTCRVAVARYGMALLASTALETRLANSPHRRSVANALATGLSAIDVLISRRERQRWLGPVFLMKVIGGHAGIPRRAGSRDE